MFPGLIWAPDHDGRQTLNRVLFLLAHGIVVDPHGLNPYRLTMCNKGLLNLNTGLAPGGTYKPGLHCNRDAGRETLFTFGQDPVEPFPARRE